MTERIPEAQIDAMIREADRLDRLMIHGPVRSPRSDRPAACCR